MELERSLAYARERRNSSLVTLKRDGRPQISHVVHAVQDDGRIAISVTASRAKTHNARRDPRVSLHVADESFWSYVVIEGDAELTPATAAPDDDTVEQLIALYRSLSGEHPDWDDYRRAMVADERVVLRIRPTYAYGMLGD